MAAAERAALLRLLFHIETFDDPTPEKLPGARSAAAVRKPSPTAAPVSAAVGAGAAPAPLAPPTSTALIVLPGDGSVDVKTTHAHEIVEDLWLGAAEARHEVWCRRHRICAVVDCVPRYTGGKSPLHKSITLYQHVPFEDVSGGDSRGSIVEGAHAVARAIAHARSAGGATLVHCQAGISRSASVAIAYLMMHRGMPLLDAAVLVRRRRPEVYPNAGFWHHLRWIEGQVHGGRTTISADDVKRHRHHVPPFAYSKHVFVAPWSPPADSGAAAAGAGRDSDVGGSDEASAAGASASTG
jgi:predicted protein tyrosine phosphatase